MGEGTPWVPERLDDYLEEPFEEIEQLRSQDVLSRLERMERMLDELATELDELLSRREIPVH